MGNGDWLSLRRKLYDEKTKSVRLSILSESKESKDFKSKENCNGLGRLRHFKEFRIEKWISDPLPMFPAAKALNCEIADARVAQVFQIAGCNYRCWYCFVDFELLSANKSKSKMVGIRELLEMYLEQENKPLVIDLSGGNPGLVPEWVVWTMKEIERLKVQDRTYLWVDDNLSVDYFSKFLTNGDINYINQYKNFGSVACFKGFDKESYQFNTHANMDLYANQFEIFKKYYSFGWDIYAYVTFTTPTIRDIEDRINTFVDNLQKIDKNLPLKTIPLEIKVYTPTSSRMNENRYKSIEYQYEVLEKWNKCLSDRFDNNDLQKQICDISFVNR